MRKPLATIIATTTVLVLVADLPGQGRGRFGRRLQRQQTETPPPAEEKEDKPVEKWLAIVGGDVYLGTGQRLTGATVLVGDDKIHGVGHSLELPEGTEEIDAKGKVVAPGFVAVSASGMGAPRSAPFKDGLNPFDPSIKQALAAGVTAFMAGNPGSGSAPGGDTAVIKLAYGDLDGMMLREATVYGIRVPLSPADLEKMREAVEKAREHEKALAEFTEKKAAEPEAKPPKAPQGIDPYLKILDGEAKLWVTFGGGRGFFRRGGGGGGASDLGEIRQAMEIARILGKGVVLRDPLCAWVAPDEIATTGSMVILNPRRREEPDPENPAVTGSNLAAAAILDQAGVPVAVTPPSGRFGGAGVGTGGILGQDLNTPHIDAAFAVRGGMDNRKALRTITLDAARMIGAETRIGSLEKGKDADILILDGDPLHYRTFVETALVNGKVVYEKAKEPFYSHIKR